MEPQNFNVKLLEITLAIWYKLNENFPENTREDLGG